MERNDEKNADQEKGEETNVTFGLIPIQNGYTAYIKYSCMYL